MELQQQAFTKQLGELQNAASRANVGNQNAQHELKAFKSEMQ